MPHADFPHFSQHKSLAIKMQTEDWQENPKPKPEPAAEKSSNASPQLKGLVKEAGP